MHPPDRFPQIHRRDRLGHVAPSTRSDHSDDIIGRIRDREREEPRLYTLAGDAVDDGRAASIGQMHVEHDHVGTRLNDPADRVGDRARVTHDLDPFTELSTHARAEQPVVVDEEHPDRHVAALGTTSRTSVPRPSADVIDTSPPERSILPSIESAMPRRSSAISARWKPTP